MIIIRIQSGVGNQMFQYAYARSLQELGYTVRIDTSYFENYKIHEGYQLDKYKINLEIANKKDIQEFMNKNILYKVMRKIGLTKKKIFHEKSMSFNKLLLSPPRDNNYLIGCFQSEKYFLNIKDILFKEFILKNKLSDYAELIKNKIMNSNNSCSIHVRRGDFISATNSNIHGACSLDYYKKAIKYVDRKFEDLVYYVFSDDINWAKENFDITNTIFIDSQEQRLANEDIYLMSLCNHNIIANSTFSWWGSWLNQNKEKIVIAPKKWFEDKKLQQQSFQIVPTEWVKI